MLNRTFETVTNASQKILIGLLKVYRYVISPILGNHCRFYPSCSQYSLIAIQRFGSIKGIYLTFKRLIRCHPFCLGGCDPVPTQHRY